MATIKPELLNRIIALYGFEHKVTIAFAEAIERDLLDDWVLEAVVKAHEEHPWTEED